MPPPKTHPNNGATVWASIPDNLVPQFSNAVLTVNTQVPSDYVVYVTDKKELLEPAFASQKGVKFRPEYVETWHARHIPGHSVIIGTNPWDKHPAYAGPEDTKVFVYVPKIAEEKAEEERKKEWAATEKAKIAAKAAKDQEAVDGALAAGEPADPTPPVGDPPPAPKKGAVKKTTTKKTTTKKKGAV